LTYRSNNRTGRLIIDLLTEKGMTQSELAGNTATSASFTNHITTGRRLPPASWLDLVSQTMDLTQEKRLELHRSAYLDLAAKYGYVVDPEKPDESS
jgi:hypothetical protein